MYPTSTSYSPELLELLPVFSRIAATPEPGSQDYIRRLSECGTKYLSPNLPELAFSLTWNLAKKGLFQLQGRK